MKIFALFLILLFAPTVSAQTFSAAKYYQLADGNEWRYTAPPGWKDGDYISRVVRVGRTFPEFQKIDDIYSVAFGNFALKGKGSSTNSEAFRHYDATKASKFLVNKKDGIYYVGEDFAGGESFVKFDSEILWFPRKIKLGDAIETKTSFTRFYKNGKTTQGTFEIKQKIAAVENCGCGRCNCNGRSI